MEARPPGWGWIGRLKPRTFDRLLVGVLLLFGLIATLFDLRFAERGPGFVPGTPSGLAAGVFVGIAYVLAIEGILFRLLGGFDAGWVTTIEKFFLGQNAGALIRSFGQPFPSPGAAAPIVTAGVAVLVLVVYSLVFAGVTSVVVRTRDVT